MKGSLNQIIPILKNLNKFSSLKPEILYQKPYIIKIKNLLSPNDCQHIINLAKNRLSPSTTVVNNQEIVSSSRSSKSAYLIPSGQVPLNDPIIQRLLVNCSIIAGIPVTHFEGMKVVNYAKDQEYQAHHDFFGLNDKFTKGVGDRFLTFFIYLNTLNDSDGGCTFFPKLNIRSQPELGDALFWTNLDEYGNPYDDTLHAGEPVLTDCQKWGVNIWIRQNSYKLS